MVIGIELRIFNQTVTSASFRLKIKAGKVAASWEGGFYLFMKYDIFRQNADFYKKNRVYHQKSTKNKKPHI